MLRVRSSTLVIFPTLMLLLGITGQELTSAPDDADPFCTSLPGRTEYTPGEKVLLDTQNYMASELVSELGEDRRWLNVGPDSNASGKWRDLGVGGDCQHRLGLCGLDGTLGTDDLWLVTQYINISFPGVTQLMVNVTYASSVNSECIANSTNNCSGFLRIRTYETDSANEIQRSLKSSYANDFDLSYSSASVEDATETSQPIILSGSYNGLYLALTTDSDCISILRLAVFYYSCPAQVVAGTIYPETIAPVNGASGGTTAIGTCVPFASSSLSSNSSQQLLLECRVGGVWNIMMNCRCIRGYFPSDDICKGCPANTYKPTWGNYGCEPCPANSVSDSGKDVCECVDGFYRVSLPGIKGFNCTGPPGPPSNLIAKIVLADSITIAWDQPLDLGGSDEIQYTVIFNNSRSGELTVIDGLTVTTYTFLDLVPRTRYIISVVSMNDVSHLASSLAGSTATISATTLSLETSPPLQVRVVINATVVQLIWTEPEIIAGELTNYQVLASTANDTNEALTYLTEHTYFNLANLAMLDSNGDLYYLWVRAVGSFGSGELSEVVTYAPQDSSSDLTLGATIAICTAILVTILVTTIVILSIHVMTLRKKSFERRRLSDATEMNRCSQTPPIPPSDERPDFIRGGRQKGRLDHDHTVYASIANLPPDVRPDFIRGGKRRERHERDPTIYTSISDPVPVYQEVDESVDNMYDYARRDTEIRNLIKHIKSQRSKEEIVYVGMAPRDNSPMETSDEASYVGRTPPDDGSLEMGDEVTYAGRTLQEGGCMQMGDGVVPVERTQQGNGSKEADDCHRVDEECNRHDDSGGDRVSTLNRSTEGSRVSYVTVTS